MRGHEELLAMRRRGMKPWLVDVDLEPNGCADWPQWSLTPMVQIAPTDSIRRLDLRFLVGLPVIVSGLDAERVRTAFEACKAAGAARVLAFAQSVDEWGEVRTVEAMDSAAEVAHG